MENLIKGWITSLIGLALFVFAALHYFGIVKLPNPEALNNTWESVIAIIIGLAFFRIPYSKMEEFLESLFSSIVGAGKKKIENL